MADSRWQKQNAQVIVLNGAASPGKSTLIRALPPRLTSPEGLEFGADGQVTVGPAFRAAERAWMQGVGHTARCGVNVITGRHRQQAEVLHPGVQYDKVDSAARTPAELARMVAARLLVP